MRRLALHIAVRIAAVAIAAWSSGCVGVVDDAFTDAATLIESEEEANPCGPVLDCMMGACTYQHHASGSRAQGYVAGCVEACMGVLEVAEEDRWVRGAAGRAFASCETDADDCGDLVLECVE